MSNLVTLSDLKDFLGIANTTTFPAVIASMTITAATNRIVRVAGSWVTDGVNVGTQITLAGFSNAGNNVAITVKSVISALEIEAEAGPVFVDEGPVATATFQKAAIAGNTTYDTFLTQQIEYISAAVEGYCGRIFELADYIQTFYQDEVTENASSDTFKNLPLYHFPVASITEVKEIEATDPLDATEYRLHKNSGNLRRLNGWGGLRDFEVTYSAGYATIPVLVQNVVFQIIQVNYNKKVANIETSFGSDVQSISIPGVLSLTYDYTLTKNDRESRFGSIVGEHANVLDAYRAERVIMGDVRREYVEPA